MKALTSSNIILTITVLLAHLFGSNVSAEVLQTLSGAPSSAIYVTKNQAVVVKAAEPFAELSIANPNIADISTLSNRTVYILGKTLGQTTITFLDKEGTLITNVNVHVTPDIVELKQRLAEILPNEKIEINTANDGIVLYGVVSSTKNISRAMNLAQRYAPEATSNLMRIAEPVSVRLSIRLTEMHHNVRKTLNSLMLDSSFVDESSAREQNKQSVLPRTEKTDQSSDPTNFTADALKPTISLLDANDDDIEMLLHALEQKGVVRALTETELEISEDEYLDLLAKRDFLMPINNINGDVEVKAKPLGIHLRIQPHIGEGSLLELAATLSASSIKNVSQINKKTFEHNEFQTRTVSKTMRLFEDQSIMITDLIEDDLKKLASHKNILRDIPFIGSIFESPDYLNSQSELAIIITPSITSSKDE